MYIRTHLTQSDEVGVFCFTILSLCKIHNQQLFCLTCMGVTSEMAVRIS